jgi:hypothetical protein
LPCGDAQHQGIAAPFGLLHTVDIVCEAQSMNVQSSRIGNLPIIGAGSARAAALTATASSFGALAPKSRQFHSLRRIKERLACNELSGNEFKQMNLQWTIIRFDR